MSISSKNIPTSWEAFGVTPQRSNLFAETKGIVDHTRGIEGSLAIIAQAESLGVTRLFPVPFVPKTRRGVEDEGRSRVARVQANLVVAVAARTPERLRSALTKDLFTQDVARAIMLRRGSLEQEVKFVAALASLVNLPREVRKAGRNLLADKAGMPTFDARHQIVEELVRRGTAADAIAAERMFAAAQGYGRNTRWRTFSPEELELGFSPDLADLDVSILGAMLFSS